MLTALFGTDSFGKAMLRLLAAAVAGWCSVVLYVELLGRFAMARFWESTLPYLGSVATAAPVILLALLSGLVFGFLLAFAFRVHARRLAVLAGVIAAIYMLWGDVDVVWAASSIALLLGFISGGFLEGRIRRNRQ